MAIQFVEQDLVLQIKGKNLLKNWVKEVIKAGGFQVGEINLVFVSDAFLLEKNRQFLSHDDYTDVITFDYSEGETLSGDILISLERVTENSKDLSVPFMEECNRVMIHGILHLMGYQDKVPVEQLRMREAENLALKQQGGWLVSYSKPKR